MTRSVAARLHDCVARRVGGAAYVAPIVLLASVVSLDGADKGTLSVNARDLEQAFGIGHTGLGLLASVSSLTGAVFTLPVGVLSDRVVRVRLLGGSILLWAIATALSAVAPSFTWFIVTRAALGAVTATAGPTVASLVGDYFPVSRRAQLYGYVLMGEFLGTGVGLVMTTAVVSFASWRFAVAWPAVPAVLLAWAVWRAREPSRGGQAPDYAKDSERPSCHRRSEAQAEAAGAAEPPAEGLPTDDAPTRDTGYRLVVEQDVPVRPKAVLRDDPRRIAVPKAYAYVLHIRTVLIMITASSLGYFFFAGVRTFGVLFATEQYNISRTEASALILVVGAGGVAGLYAGGRTADRLLRSGHPNARVIVPTVSLLVSPLALAPAILLGSPWAALPLLIAGVTTVAATNPPLDAARLDIVPSGLWGTAESVRTALRTLGELGAPIVFGYVSASAFPAHGLRWTFLVCLAPLTGAGLLGLVALRTYPRDVATAAASDKAVREKQGG